MHRIKNILLILFFGIHINTACAEINHSHHMPSQTSKMPQSAASISDFKLNAMTQSPLNENAAAQVTLFLQEKTTQKPVTEDQLQVVHTKKMHALIIDPTLTDYHHVHPIPGNKPGEYIFTFTPATSYNYRIWLDITPVNGEQQYLMADLRGKTNKNPPVKKILATKSQVGNYHFELTFDKKQLKVGEAVMGRVKITDKNGKPVNQLEPIMAAFAHIVAFNQDFHTILHVHPMGEEPKTLDARGGPTVDFHITPTVSGYVKLFVQVQINGKEIIAPFGVTVE